MGLLEDMLIKAKSAANTVGKKAGKIVDVSKLNFELVDLKSNLKSKFENVGKIVYSETKNGYFSESSIKNEIKEIDEIFYRIEKLQKEIALLKNKIICKACGTENTANSLYCNKCGHTLEIRCTCKNDEKDKNIKDNACKSENCECTDNECPEGISTEQNFSESDN